MNIAQKLQVLRKNKGISQESLAEKLAVSRQAIGKWESGQSYPDIDKLIQLSEFYKISLDRLLKDEGDCTIRLLNNETHSQDDLIQFLLRAKRACYAGHGEETKASRRCSHDLDYQEEDLYYYDTYLGGERFGGEEAIWKNETPLWCMNYYGRVIGEPFSGDFLKEALSAVPFDSPFRGPAFYQNGNYTYHCKADGDFEWYDGCEEILYEGTLIYECRFHGGIIK